MDKVTVSATSMLQRRVLAATSISYAVVLLDASIVNVALERISKALATDIAGLQWIVSAYTLAFASLLLTGGISGDRWGARNVYLAGLIAFILASALCGLAPDLMILIAARTLQGVGAAMLVPCSLTLISHAYPHPQQRASAIGVWVGCGGVAMAAGPLVGGILIHLFDWRSIFLVNAPIGVVGIWLTCRIPRDKRSLHARPFDPAGQITAMLALGALIAVLIEGSRLGWRSPTILAGMTIDGMAWVAFLLIEARRSHPMLPLHLFKNAIFSGSTLISMVSAFVFYGLTFLLGLYFQRVHGYSPLWTGLSFLPLTAVMVVGSMLSGPLVARYGQRWPMCAAFGLYMLGFLGLTLLTPASPYWLAALSMPAIGIAAGFISPAATAPAIGTVEKSQAGIAAGVLNSARQTGAALGIAVFGTLIATSPSFENGMHAALWIAAAVSLAAAVIWRLTITGIPTA